MVSKNNLSNHLKFKNDNKQRFSIRKLGVGVASVLIGTTIYMGTVTVNADETASLDSNKNLVISKDDTNSDNADQNMVSLKNTNQNVNNKEGIENDSELEKSNETIDNSDNISDDSLNKNIQNRSVAESDQSDQLEKSDQTLDGDQNQVSDQLEKFNQDNNELAKEEPINNIKEESNNTEKTSDVNSKVANQRVLRSVNTDETNKDITIDDGTKLAFDKTGFDGNLVDQINVTFTSAGFQAGDTYEILVPSEYVGAVSFAGLPTGLGSSSQSTEKINGKQYKKITNKFIANGNVNQKIVFTRAFLEANGDKLYPGQVLGLDVILRKNGVDVDGTTLNYVIPTDLQGKTLGYDKNFGADVNEPKFNNINYDYAINFNAELRNSNDKSPEVAGTAKLDLLDRTLDNIQVKISVPEYFELNKDQDVYIGNQNINLGKATQDGIGQDIIINIPIDKLSNYKLVGNNIDLPIIFSGAMKVPDEIVDSATSPLEFAPKNKSSIKFTFNDGSTKTLPEFDFASVRVNNDSDGSSIGDSISVKAQDSLNWTEGDYRDVVNPDDPTKNASFTGLFNTKNVTKDVLVENEFVYELPDGLTYFGNGENKLNVKSNGVLDIYDIIAEYQDGSTSNTFKTINNGSYLKKVSFKIKTLNPGQTVQISPGVFSIAKTYQDGRLVKGGDVLKTKLTVNGDVFYQNDTIQAVPERLPSIRQEVRNLSGNGPFSPGNDATGVTGVWQRDKNSIDYELNIKNPTIFISIPQSMMVNFDITSNSFSIISDSKRLDPSKYVATPVTINGNSLVKITFEENFVVKDSLYVSLIQRPKIMPDVSNLSDGYYAFMVSDKDYTVEGANYSNTTYIGTDQSKMDDYQKSIVNGLIDQDYNAGSIVTSPKTNYNVLVSEGTTTIDLTKGNLDVSISQNSNNDVFIGDTFDVTHSLVNSSKNNISNVHSFVNIPGTYDGASQIDAELTGPIKLIDVASGQTINSGVTIKYSTDFVNVDKNNKPGLDNYVDESQVTDWSKIKSYVLVWDNFASEKSVRAIAHLRDKDSYNHAGKVIKTSSLSYADNLDTIAIKASDLASSKLTMKGSVTLHTQIKWTDENGQEHVIKVPLDKTFDLSKDQTLNNADFMTSEENPAYKAIMDQIPENYRVDFDNPIVENSNESYREGFANETAKFGEQIKYYANNDVVTYTLVPKTEELTETKDVTRTINYLAKKDNSKLAEPVVQKVTFTRKGVKNLVTNEITWNEWTSNNDTFEEVVSPDIENYKALTTEVSSVSVNENSNNIEENVYYEGKGQVTINFVDDVTGDIINTMSKEGYPSDNLINDVDSEYNSTLDRLTNELNYELVSSEYNKDNNPTYIEDENQIFVVHLTHTHEKQEESKTVTHTIKYVDEDGNTLFDNVDQSVEFVRTGSKDKVINEITWNEWSPEQTFASVNSPEKAGYTPDKPIVDEVKVNHDSENVETIVVYRKDEQKIKVVYIDDTTGNVLKTDDMIGKSGEDADYNTKSSIDNYLDNGYELISDQTDGSNLTYDFDKNVDQNYEVHLKHTYEPQQETNKVDHTIKYIDEEGNTLFDNVDQSLEFTRTGSKDKVTNEIDWGEWTPTQTFESIDSPEKAGYTPDQKVVKNISVDYNSDNVETIVTYTKDQQNIKVVYIDDTTGKTLETDDLVGKSGENTDYTTLDKINNYVAKGYKLVSDQTNGEKLVYDYDSNNGQTYEVHLTHDTENVDESKSVNHTIHYVESFASLPIFDDVQQKVEFTRTGVKDKVTGEIDWNEWSPEQTFESVVSPEKPGYTPDKKVVENVVATHNSDNLDTYVMYFPDTQYIKVTYIDDVTGNVLSTKDLEGLTGETSSYSTIDSIKDYESKGYKLVSDSTNGQELLFDNDTNTNQEYFVHLTHDTEDVSDTKSIDRIIHYVDNQGKSLIDDSVQSVEFTRTGVKDKVTGEIDWNEWSPEQTFDQIDSPEIANYTPDKEMVESINVNANSNNIEETIVYTPNKEQVSESKVVTNTIRYVNYKAEQVFDTVTQELTFTRTGERNMVTGEITWSDWSPEQTFDKVVSPELKGYTPDIEVVENITVNHDSNNQGTVVEYTPNIQKLVVNYIDKTTGKTLNSVSKDGATNENSGYSTLKDVAKYQKQGYKLVSDETNGENLIFDDEDSVDQVYNVYFEHDTEEASENKFVNRTIHYIDQNGNQVVSDYVYSPAEFTRTGTKDKVTGKVTWNDWDKPESFESVKSPDLDGHTPDKLVVDEFVPNVDEPFTEATVTYSQNEQIAKITIIDVTEDKELNSLTTNGKFGETIEFTDLQKLLNEYVSNGYVVESNNFDNQTFNSDNSKNEFVVKLVHSEEPVTENKVITRTINYVDNEGNKLKDPVVQEVELTRTGTKDKVTGKVTWNDWDKSSFDSVKSPEIDGYNDPSVDEVSQLEVNYSTENSEINVVYTEKEKPVEPEQPTEPELPELLEKPVEPELPTTPEQPTEPETPKMPEVSEKPEQPAEPEMPVDSKQPESANDVKPTADSEKSVKKTLVKSTKSESSNQNGLAKVNNEELPQMGNSNEQNVKLLGFGLLTSLIGLFGINLGKKNRKEN